MQKSSRAHQIDPYLAKLFRLHLLLIVLLGVCWTSSCKSTGLRSSALQDNSSFSSMETLANPFCVIKYSPGLLADAQKFDDWLNQANVSLSNEFVGHNPSDILANIGPCTIFVHDSSNQFASEGSAVVISGFDQNTGKLTADIHFLAPSKHSPTARTSVDEPMDDNYIRKTLVHEYGTLFLQLIVKKSRGWKYFEDSFNWFEQGYEEYLGVMFSSEHSRTVTRRKYLEMALRDDGGFDFEFGMHVSNDYTNGVTLLMFMHEEFGKERVQAILTSPEHTFGKAIVTNIGSLDSFIAKFKSWRQRTLIALGGHQ